MVTWLNWQKLQRDEQGVALPLALISMLVLSLLGTALWHYSMNDALQAERRKQKLQAHYIAYYGVIKPRFR